MFRGALLIILASTTADFIAKDTECYDEPYLGEYRWFKTDIEAKITLTSDVHAIVYKRTDTEATRITIDTQGFAAAGMNVTFDFGAKNMTVDVKEGEIPNDDLTSGSTLSSHANFVAIIAACVLAVFSVHGVPSKYSMTLLVVVALAMSATTVESADDSEDCETFGAKTRVIIVITYPPTGSYTVDKVFVDTTGLPSDSLVDADSSECSKCTGTDECALGLDGGVQCVPLKGSFNVNDLLSFRWLDADCADTDAKPADTDVKGIVIFSHGWQSGGGLRKSTPCWRDEWGGKGWANGQAPEDTAVAAWIEAGWKVGQVHWERFADEGIDFWSAEIGVSNAESKIWDTGGEKGMRWKKDDGSYEERREEVPRVPIPDLLWPMVRTAIMDAANADVRVIFAGHSLGSQMISHLQLKYIEEKLITTKRKTDLWLLDAFFTKPATCWWWSRNCQPGKGERMRDEILPPILDAGTRVYRTQTSITNGPVGDNGVEIGNSVAFLEQITSFFTQLQFGEKHNVAYVMFFRSFSGFDDDTPSALNEVNMNGQCWKQVGGGASVLTDDDTFTEGSGVEDGVVLSCN